MESQNSNNTLAGVYRQRSYDNLQNGKSPFHRSSVKSLHLPSSYINNNHSNINNPNTHLANKLSLNNLNTNKFAQLSPIIQFPPYNNHNHNGSQHHHHHQQQQQQQQAIPSNFKYFSPQSKYAVSKNFDSNSLPRYPYHKNRALAGLHHQRHESVCMEYYKHPVRHPTTPPPPPPIHLKSPVSEEQVLLTTPTSSSSSNDNCSSNSEWDPMLNSAAVKRGGFDHIPHYRTCKKQIQQATQILNHQQQFYIDNYLQQFSNHSPYRKYLNSGGGGSSSSSSSSNSHHYQQHHQNYQQHLQPPPPPQQVHHNPNKRHSNVYEYHFTNFDLNSIHEDAMNES